MRLLATLFVLLLAVPAAAQDLGLAGKATVGGMMTGDVPPGTTLTQDGEPVRVSPEGLFVIGFGYDAGSTSVLEATLPDGRRLRSEIPVAPRDFDVQRIDGLPQKMVMPPAEVLERIRADAAAVREARAHDTAETWFNEGFVWPARGPVTGVYGSRRILNGEERQPHYGVDIAAPRGTPVVAPAPGVVRLAHPDMYFTGRTVIIDHGHGLSSALLHLEDLTVEAGDRVEQGQAVGHVGSTGRSTGPHLDWRINLFDKRLDPQLIAPPLGIHTPR